MMLASGTKLGPYEIVAPLGAGGMGEVYRAKDTRLGRDVAVKVLPRHLSANPEVRARFEREARSVSSLSHPHICVLHDVGRERETDFLVMELVEGETLAARLARAPLPLADVLRLGAQVADALACAHRAGVVHRDLKPGNVMLAKSGAKLMDFGLARAGAVPGGASGELSLSGLTSTPTVAAPGRSDAPLTEKGTIVGTFQYMAPEQLEGREADARGDVWALGCVLYEMASGRQAFAGDSHASLIASILKDEPRPLADLQRVPPSALEWLVKRCLAKDPDDRWQSARDVALQLEWIAAQGAPATRGASSAAPDVSFRQLTYRRGTVGAARFLPDGQTVVYGAAWGGEPERVFIRRLDGSDSAEVALPPASLLAVSRQGELALSLGRVWRAGWAECEGTLARAPVFGGAARVVAEDVQSADWSPDGREFAVILRRGADLCVEWPPGRVIVATPRWKSAPRVSPDGRHVAFMEFFGAEGNTLNVATRGGEVRTLATFAHWPGGLCWSPDGAEVWFGQHGGQDGAVLSAATLDGQVRRLLRLPGGADLQDVSEAGDVLLLQTSVTSEIAVFEAGAARERSLSWFDMGLAKDLSDDARMLLFDETGSAVGTEPQVYLRTLDGAPPISLGVGYARTISPDGRWVVAMRRGALAILPTGAGQSFEIPSPGTHLASTACWFPDGKRLLVPGGEAEGVPRFFEVPLDGGAARPVTPEGVSLMWGVGAKPLDAEGRRVFSRPTPGEVAVYDLPSGERVSTVALDPKLQPLRWHADGRRVFVFDRGRYPAVMHLLDTVTGELTGRRELAVSDSSGVFSTRFLIPSADGETVVMSCTRTLSQLFLVRGLR